MRKFFSCVMVLMVLVAALGFNVSSAGAKAATPSVPVVVLSSPYFNNLEEGKVVEGSIEGMTMYCQVIGDHKLKCVIPDVFAGQKVTIHLTVDGLAMNFRVKVPDPQKHYAI